MEMFVNYNIRERISCLLEFKQIGRQIISFWRKYQLTLFEQRNDKFWIEKQIIKIFDYGQISFLTDTIFEYMPERSPIILTYKFSEEDQQFNLNQSFELFAKKFYSYRLQTQYEDSIDALLAIRKNDFFVLQNNSCKQQVKNLIRFSNDTVSFTCTKSGQILLTLEQVKEVKDNYSYVRQLQMRNLRKQG